MPEETSTQSTSKDTGIILALVFVPIIVLFTILGVALAFAEYCNSGISFCIRPKCFRQSVKNKQKRSRSDPPRFSASMGSTSGGAGIDLDMYQRPVENMEEDTEAVLMPLRISMAPQQAQGLSKPPIGYCSPYEIPRRSSSYAIRNSLTVRQLEKPVLKQRGRYDRSTSKLLYPSGCRNDCTETTPRNSTELCQGPNQCDTKDNSEQDVSKFGIFSRLLHSLNPRLRDQNEVSKDSYGSGIFNHLSTSLLPQFPREMSNSRTNSPSTSIDDRNLHSNPESFWDGRTRKRTPPLVRPTLQVPRSRGKTGARSLRQIPITTANLELLADVQDIDDDLDVPLWLTVEITAAVGIDRGIDGDPLLPLDVMILVDNLMTTPNTSLKEVYDNAVLVATETVNNNDCVAICAIYDHHEVGLVPFLPLAVYDLDTIKRAVDYIPHLGPRVDQTRQTDVENALRESSNALAQLSHRGALCHVFLVTADSTLHLPSQLPQDRVQVHTVSPHARFSPGSWSKLNGFHLAYGTYFEDSPIARQAQIQKIDWLFREIRTGYDPGTLSNLTLNLIPGDGYTIETVLGSTTCNILRPGEKWSLVVKIRVQHHPTTQDLEDNNGTIEDLMNQLFHMLGEKSTNNETILSACLEYRQSCLPNAAMVKVERNWDAPQLPQPNDNCSGEQNLNGRVSVVGNIDLCDEARRNTEAGKLRDYQSRVEDKVDHQLLESEGSGCLEEPGTSSGADSSKSLLHCDTSCSSTLCSKEKGSPRGILGDATNKGWPGDKAQNHRTQKSSDGVVRDVMWISENRKPWKESAGRLSIERFAIESEDMPEMSQHEWHDIGWC